MTNAQIAHKKGLDFLSNANRPAEEYRRALVGAGMKVNGETVIMGNLHCYEATAETERGTLRIYCGTNGTARLDKPNGTHKWYYEKTPAQIAAVIKQTMDFYK